MEEFGTENVGAELLSFKDSLVKTIGRLKELETTSRSNSKIGLETIRNSIEDLVKLDGEIDNQIQSLENNFIEP